MDDFSRYKFYLKFVNANLFKFRHFRARMQFFCFKYISCIHMSFIRHNIFFRMSVGTVYVCPVCVALTVRGIPKQGWTKIYGRRPCSYKVPKYTEKIRFNFSFLYFFIFWLFWDFLDFVILAIYYFLGVYFMYSAFLNFYIW